jgi:hypothetical protein
MRLTEHALPGNDFLPNREPQTEISSSGILIPYSFCIPEGVGSLESVGGIGGCEMNSMSQRRQNPGCHRNRYPFYSSDTLDFAASATWSSSHTLLFLRHSLNFPPPLECRRNTESEFRWKRFPSAVHGWAENHFPVRRVSRFGQKDIFP